MDDEIGYQSCECICPIWKCCFHHEEILPAALVLYDYQNRRIFFRVTSVLPFGSSHSLNRVIKIKQAIPRIIDDVLFYYWLGAHCTPPGKQRFMMLDIAWTIELSINPFRREVDRLQNLTLARIYSQNGLVFRPSQRFAGNCDCAIRSFGSLSRG